MSIISSSPAYLMLIGAAAFLLLCFGFYGVRVLIAWAQRRPPPQEHRSMFATLAAAVGVVLGWLAYQPLLDMTSCHERGEPVIPCLMIRFSSSEH